MESSTHPPSLASDAEDAWGDSGIDKDDYPFGVPSFSPSITNVKEIQRFIQDKARYSDTNCDIFEASSKGCQWRRGVDDEGLKKTLHDCESSGDGKAHFRAL